jgi:hypothetical protein
MVFNPSLFLLRERVRGRLEAGERLARLLGIAGLEQRLRPSGIFVFGHGADLDRHVGVVLAAELRALAVVDTFLLDLEPVLVEAAGDGVDLDAEGRDGPGMDDAFGIGGDGQLDDLADRHHDRHVSGEKPFVAGLVLRLEIGGETRPGAAVLVEAEIWIFVGPVPARIADDLDVDVALGHVALEVEKPERRNGDGHQDEDRNHRPQHLDQRVVRGLGGNRVGLGVEPYHHIEKQAEHEERDQRDDDEQEVVQRMDPRGDRRDGVLEAELPGLGIAGRGQRRCGRRRKPHRR